MNRAVLAGGVYWLIVFTGAFGLGVLRVLLVAPRLGAIAAVLLETPLLLAASWFACRWTLKRFAVGSAAVDRLAMGAVAFGLLMCAEIALSSVAFGRPLADWLAGFRTIPGVIGLTAQIAFGFVPFVQRATRAA